MQKAALTGATFTGDISSYNLTATGGVYTPILSVNGLTFTVAASGDLDTNGYIKSVGNMIAPYISFGGTSLITQLALKATKASPTFTGTVYGIDKTMVGLANVDNTTDLNKPISTLTQTRLRLLAPKANPQFTGTISGITYSMVGFGNCNNTTDLAKPISTLTQTQLNLLAPCAGATFTGDISSYNLTARGGVYTPILNVNGMTFLQ